VVLLADRWDPRVGKRPTATPPVAVDTTGPGLEAQPALLSVFDESDGNDLQAANRLRATVSPVAASVREDVAGSPDPIRTPQNRR
jgi:hypothetical protein